MRWWPRKPAPPDATPFIEEDPALETSPRTTKCARPDCFNDIAPDSLAARHAFDADEIGARRLPDEEAGTRQPPAHRVRLAARDGDTFVDYTLIQDRGDDVCGTPEWLEAFDP